MTEFPFKAFISYSHKDKKEAAWLQRKLESYKVPRDVRSEDKVSSRLGKVFRDREELSAGGDLSLSIREAINKSEFLIVLCSPAAKESYWVNQEILQFRETHARDKILCYVVDRGAEELNLTQSCFPPALYEPRPGEVLSDYEPIAADLRDEADGRKLARLKIIAGLLNVELDQIVKREAQRRNSQLIALTVASTFGMLVLASLTLIAFDARQEEEARRAEAEDLVEFMLTDLRVRLEEVGRLDVLDAVGTKAIDYYSKVELTQHSDTSLGRRARAFHLLGEVGELRGETEAAKASFLEAYQSTGELLLRSPSDTQRIFNHAQSVFWLGYLERRLGNYDKVIEAFSENLTLAKQLIEFEPNNPDWIAEVGHANLNMGVYVFEVGTATEAIDYFSEALRLYKTLVEIEQDNSLWKRWHAEASAWLSDALRRTGRFEEALEYRLHEITTYEQMGQQNNDNQRINRKLINSYHVKAELSLLRGNTSQAIVDLRKSLTYGETLLAIDPENTWVVAQTAAVYGDLGDALLQDNQLDECRVFIQQALALVSELRRDHKETLQWKRIRLGVEVQHARYLIAIGKLRVAETQLLAAAAELKMLIQQNPDLPTLRYEQAEVLYYLGKCVSTDPTGAISPQYAKLVIDALSDPASRPPSDSLAILSIAYRIIGQDDLALELETELRSMAFKHPALLAEMQQAMR